MKPPSLPQGPNDAPVIAVRRPERWDEPMDPTMTPSDIQWLLRQQPFSSLDPSSFPRTIPLDGILLNDCRLLRVKPGQVVCRQGDYANSAFLVLDGSVRLLTEGLPEEDLGRVGEQPLSWTQSLRKLFFPSGVPEARRPEEITPNGNWNEGQGEPQQANAHAPDAPVLFLQDIDAVVRRGQAVSLHAGELFGEVAAMYRSPRTATVVADESATLLEIRWQGLKMLRRDRGFADRMEQHYRDTWLPLHLRELPLLRHLPEINLKRVVANTHMQSFGRMQWNADYKKTRELSPAEQIAGEPVVAPEGRQATELIVVRSGFGRVCQRYGAGMRTTAYLGKGHLFGLEDLVLSIVSPPNNPPGVLQQTLTAVGFLDTLHIPLETFASEILPHIRRSELPARAADALVSAHSDSVQRSSNERRRNRREDSEAPTKQAKEDRDAAPTGTKFESTALLEFIVQHRFNNGREAMVIDLHRCTRCDDCLNACASVHDGNARFTRVGQTHGRVQFVQACMHCTDPVCMIGCPTGAIHRDEGSGHVRISEPICIGCAVCSNSCPYDAIHMAEIRDPQGVPYTDAKSGKPINKPTKCDMCAGLPTGPACASACPHDALVRIDLSESPPLEDWLRRRAS